MKQAQLRRIALLAAALVIFAAAAAAQPAAKTKVCVALYGADAMGIKAAEVIKAEIAKSPAYALGTLADSAYYLYLVTIDVAERKEDVGKRSVVTALNSASNHAHVVQGDPKTWLPFLINSGIYAVKADNVAAQAKLIADAFDAAVKKYKGYSAK